MRKVDIDKLVAWHTRCKHNVFMYESLLFGIRAVDKVGIEVEFRRWAALAARVELLINKSNTENEKT